MNNRLTIAAAILMSMRQGLILVLNWSWRHITQGGFVLSANNRLILDAYDFTIEDDDAASSSSAEAIDEVLSANSAAFTLAYPLQRMAQNDRQTLS